MFDKIPDHPNLLNQEVASCVQVLGKLASYPSALSVLSSSLDLRLFQRLHHSPRHTLCDYCAALSQDQRLAV